MAAATVQQVEEIVGRVRQIEEELTRQRDALGLVRAEVDKIDKNMSGFAKTIEENDTKIKEEIRKQSEVLTNYKDIIEKNDGTIKEEIKNQKEKTAAMELSVNSEVSKISKELTSMQLIIENRVTLTH